MRKIDQQTAQGLGKVAYEQFAEKRMERGSAMPAWHSGPGNIAGLPAIERDIWIEVALAVAAHLPFVIDEDTLEAAYGDLPGNTEVAQRWRDQLRHVAEAAGFTVMER